MKLQFSLSALALATLLFGELSGNRSLGLAGAVGIVVAMAYALTVLPAARLGGMGRTAVFLQGPATATGYSFFYDGARRQGTVPVFYNGDSAVPPQVSGSTQGPQSMALPQPSPM